jgi:septum formation protein
VLGADTTVFLDGVVLNKPADLDDARRMLRRLAGRTHTVFTGLALRRARDGLRLDRGEESQVTFRAFGEAEIEDYLRRVNVLDKAGAYAIQEGAERIVSGHTGSFSNIVGLPLETTKQILTEGGLTG